MTARKPAPVEPADELPTPEPLPGFVRVRHDDIDAVADIPEGALSSHESRGWVLDSPPEATPEAVASDPNPKES